MIPPLLSIPDAAKILGISGHTLRGHVTAGRIAHRRIGGAIRFTEGDVEEFVEASKKPVRREETPKSPAQKREAYVTRFL